MRKQVFDSSCSRSLILGNTKRLCFFLNGDLFCNTADYTIRPRYVYIKRVVVIARKSIGNDWQTLHSVWQTNSLLSQNLQSILFKNPCAIFITGCYKCFKWIYSLNIHEYSSQWHLVLQTRLNIELIFKQNLNKVYFVWFNCRYRRRRYY